MKLRKSRIRIGLGGDADLARMSTRSAIATTLSPSPRPSPLGRGRNAARREASPCAPDYLRFAQRFTLSPRERAVKGNRAIFNWKCEPSPEAVKPGATPGNARGFLDPRTFARPLICASTGVLLAGLTIAASAQSADWQTVIWREPQVRYLLADLSLGGNVAMYRDYALREKDPDSCEAIRLWDAGVRVVNTNEVERRWVTNRFSKDGRVMRVVQHGSNRSITGNELVLSNDGAFAQTAMRLVLLDLTLGCSVSDYEKRNKSDPAVAEALRRWAAGCRAINAGWFDVSGTPPNRRLSFGANGLPVDGARVILNSDVAYPEVNVRYFLADIFLGGSREFYQQVAESAHEMGCQEAVARYDAGVTILNLEQFERRQIDGKILIARKGGRERISGSEVKLSTD
jgi:hypothetical protein